MCLIKGCICWWCYQNARYNNKKKHRPSFFRVLRFLRPVFNLEFYLLGFSSIVCWIYGNIWESLAVLVCRVNDKNKDGSRHVGPRRAAYCCSKRSAASAKKVGRKREKPRLFPGFKVEAAIHTEADKLNNWPSKIREVETVVTICVQRD